MAATVGASEPASGRAAYAGGVCDSDSEPEPSRTPSLRASLDNWRTYDAPVPTKLRLVVANNLIKLRKHQGCCGNHGQPGC